MDSGIPVPPLMGIASEMTTVIPGFGERSSGHHEDALPREGAGPDIIDDS